MIFVSMRPCLHILGVDYRFTYLVGGWWQLHIGIKEVLFKALPCNTPLTIIKIITYFE